MNKDKILKKLGVILIPSLLWFVLATLGFGAQSLSNLIELFAIFILSVICTFIPESLIKFKHLIITLLVITFFVRLFTPIIPE